MSDLISRQAAIDALDEIEAEVADGYGYQYAKWREYFVEIPSAQPEQRWIPCSERLPEDVQVGEEYPTVIFCTKEETYTGFYEYYRGGRWWREDYDEIVEGVLAWMPKPAPYKEERREE